MIRIGARRFVPVISSLMVLSGGVSAAEHRPHGGKQSSARIASTCSASPEGLIIFNTTRDGNAEIYSMHPDGSHLVNLTNNPAGDAIPMVNAEGERITFASDRLGAANLEIYVMNVDGSGLANITNDPGYDYDPAPNEAADKFAWVSGRGGKSDIWVANIDGSHPVRITSDPVGAFNPNWSPDGTQIVFASSRDNNNGEEIYLMNANGTGQTRLTFTAGRDFYPIFTPDGTKIAFTSERDGHRQIYLMNLDGTNQVNFSPSPFWDQLPYFNYEGTKMSFVSSRDDPNGEIYVVNVDGTGLTRITSNPAVDAYPAWSEDPTADDNDGDGVPDVCDICPTVADPAQDPADTDGDGVPDECDGCVDVDHDGYRASGTGAPGFCNCSPSCAFDCAPNVPAVNPGAAEIPGNGVDDDCDAATVDCVDADGDGYSATGGACGATDCNDANANVNPGKTEVPGNGVDDDCNPATSDCKDLDGDGYGSPAAAVCAHPQLDCNDSNANVNPGRTEVPSNGLDDDCNPATPGGCTPQLAEASVATGSASRGIDLGLYLVPGYALVAFLRRSRRRLAS